LFENYHFRKAFIFSIGMRCSNNKDRYYLLDIMLINLAPAKSRLDIERSNTFSRILGMEYIVRTQ